MLWIKQCPSQKLVEIQLKYVQEFTCKRGIRLVVCLHTGEAYQSIAFTTWSVKDLCRLKQCNAVYVCFFLPVCTFTTLFPSIVDITFSQGLTPTGPHRAPPTPPALPGIPRSTSLMADPLEKFDVSACTHTCTSCT